MTAPLGYGSRRLVTVRSPRNDFLRVPILTPKPYNWVLPWIFLFCRSLWLPWMTPWSPLKKRAQAMVFDPRQDPEQAGVLAEGREGRCGHTRIVEVRSLVEQRALHRRQQCLGLDRAPVLGGVGKDLICTLRFQRMRRIKSPDIIGATSCFSASVQSHVASPEPEPRGVTLAAFDLADTPKYLAKDCRGALGRFSDPGRQGSRTLGRRLHSEEKGVNQDEQEDKAET